MLWLERGSAASIVSLLLAGVGLLAWWSSEGGRFAVLTIAATVAALAFGHEVKLHPMVRHALLWLGDISYPMFLLHWPLFCWLVGVVGAKQYSLFMSSAVLVSALALHLVDKPMRHTIVALFEPAKAPVPAE
jgi:peptidoglycan/LPS O-acetylase OafA/YrhL